MSAELHLERLHLGVVDHRWHMGQMPVANLVPLWEAKPDGHAWAYPFAPEELKAVFPNRGIVLWIDPLDDAVEGTLWVFRLVDQRKTKPDAEYNDWIKVQGTATRATEALDLERLGGVAEGFQRLNSSGIELPSPSQSDWLLRLPDDWWAGPVELVPVPQSSRWILAGRYQHQVCPCRHWPQGAAAVEVVQHGMQPRLILPPVAVLPDATQQIDLAPDVEVFRRALRHLRSLDGPYAESVGLTLGAVDRLTELLASQKGQDMASHLHQWRLERVRALLERLSDQQHQAEFARQYLEEGPLTDELVRQRGIIIEQIQKQARNAIAAEIAQEEDRLRKVRKAVEVEEHQAEEARRSARAARAEQEALLGRFEVALADRIDAVRASPEAFFAEAVLLRAALQPAALPAQAVVPTKALPPHAEPRSQPISDHTALRPLLELALDGRDAPRALAPPLHAAFLAGAVPLLAGGRAYETLAAYATCVAGGRCLWLPVPPTALTPADLFGRVEAGRFLPNAGGLANLFRRAAVEDKLFLIVLDGVNRAACDAYLLPMLACYADAGRSDGRVLPLFAPDAVTVDDLYGDLAHLRWPLNVLLAGTLIEGTATVGLPPALWGYAVVLLTDPFATGPSPPALSPTAVPPASWAAWRKEVQLRDATSCVRLWEEAGRGDLGRDHRDLCLRFFRTLRTWMDESTALACVTAFSLTPALGHGSGSAKRLADRPSLYPDVNAALRALVRVLG